MISKSETDQVRVILSSLLDRNELISARSLAKALGIQPSSVTRSTWRMQLLSEYQSRQTELRARVSAFESDSRSGKKVLAAQIVKRDCRIRELERTVEILSAAHRKLIAVVVEMGGRRALVEFYKRSSEMRREIEAHDALVDID